MDGFDLSRCPMDAPTAVDTAAVVVEESGVETCQEVCVMGFYL